MPMGLTPGFLSKGINLHALYGSISSGFSSSVANFSTILAIVFEISTDCCPKCVDRLSDQISMDGKELIRLRLV